MLQNNVNTSNKNTQYSPLQCPTAQGNSAFSYIQIDGLLDGLDISFD
jgi:hypothetical protein